jgi:hypothetical protein
MHYLSDTVVWCRGKIIALRLCFAMLRDSDLAAKFRSNSRGTGMPSLSSIATVSPLSSIHYSLISGLWQSKAVLFPRFPWRFLGNLNKSKCPTSIRRYRHKLGAALINNLSGPGGERCWWVLTCNDNFWRTLVRLGAWNVVQWKLRTS